ncbi:MAG: hypothetical protein GY859_39890, partial [Desulfobacterales bacterium]|nr:hypothetical protein [Desulfobacterales bacterium]
AQATREGLRQALFGRIAPCARAEDEVIIFFAGHGLASRDRFFLALHDSNLDRLELTGYEMQELRDVIHYNVKSNRIVLFFDVCHSGAMNIEREPASILNTRLTQWSQTGSNLTIFSASSDKEASYEYPSCCPGGACDRGEEGPFSEAGHGVFTCALLHGLTGGALPMGETSVSLDLLADHLARSVPAATGQRQHPVTFGKLDEGFILTMPRDVGQGGGSGVKREDEQGEEGVK